MKIAEVQVPRTIHEALSQSDWRKAVFYEMSALEKTNTWEIVDLLKDKNTVGWEELKDVKNAFLNGDWKEEAYMEIPLGFEGNNDSNKVCKLQKALYGLKQSPRAWFDRFTKGMWIKRLLEELKFPIDSPMRIFCDNQAAISVAKNLVHHDRTKHVEIDCHFTKE
uniref:Reverse transcriptase Ty1/copia-type domain-containing protein n=1 Tax=Vitis vinifera TaxID=29760 RepID=A5AS38_VITVI|nr:hypothetical protein VITISV_011148 [Vitis vinifera]